jgi:hypothetical protein
MRKTALLVGTMLTALLALSGVAWALTTIDCAEPGHGPGRLCWGTDGNELIIGTDSVDRISSERGDDVVRAGRGADWISTGDSDWHRGDSDWHRGNDANYGGRGMTTSRAS